MFIEAVCFGVLIFDEIKGYFKLDIQFINNESDQKASR